MALEQARYEVLRRLEPECELRSYARHCVAEIQVAGTREQAGRSGFRTLVKYLYGKNRGFHHVAMTAPVCLLDVDGDGDDRAGDAGLWTVQIVMPAAFTLDTLPRPHDPAIRLREVAPRSIAALRYAGKWSADRYVERLATLRTAVRRAGLEPSGRPVWARYSPPFTPSFLRRNEILVEVKDGAQDAAGPRGQPAGERGTTAST